LLQRSITQYNSRNQEECRWEKWKRDREKKEKSKRERKRRSKKRKKTREETVIKLLFIHPKFLTTIQKYA
jgi:hypothetical protein